MAPSKHPENIAIVGATGHIGKFFVAELLKTGKHTITAVTRAESKGIIPEGVKRIQVDYNEQDSLVAALRGQDFFIISLAVRAPPDTHGKLVRAAAAAGVPYVMPNFFGSDIRNPKLASGTLGAAIKRQLDEMENLGVSYVSLACGIWYEWSLALGDAWFGFQIRDRRVTFFDDGETAVDVSTWPLCGRAVAALLSLPGSGAAPALDDWKNAPVYIRSFWVSQRDMLDSLHRVLGTTDGDWEIAYEPAAKRAQDGLDELARGVFTGMAKKMYAEVFERSRAGELGYPRAPDNEVLGLPHESLDEATKRAVEMVESDWNPRTG